MRYLSFAQMASRVFILISLIAILLLRSKFSGLDLFFVTAPRMSLAVLQSTMTTLSYADYKSEVLDLLLSTPTHTLAVANKDKLSNKRQLLYT